MRNRAWAVLAFALAAGCAGKAAEKAEPARESPPAAETVTPAAPAASFKALPPVTGEGGRPLFTLLAQRRSSRTYGSRKLSDEEVGALLWAGQGITSGRGLRTAPSAGALYPMTLYYADDAGLWRYDAGRRRRARAAETDVRPALAAAGLGQAPLKRAPAIIVVVARPSVTAVKYGGRAERYCMMEAGHICQNILLAAEDLGLGACPVGAFRDDDVLAALALGEDYLPLYMIPVGEEFRP
jgi:SagB-type dehydrogenase family enzyme